MSRSTLTRELALRIGLAARALPGTGPKLFVSVLSACVVQPLSEQTVATLDLVRFQQALRRFGINADASAVKLSLQILQNPVETGITPVNLQNEMPCSIRIAIGSDDARIAIGHFGSCRQFFIYQVAAQEADLIDVRNVSIEIDRKYPDKNVYRAQLIADCRVLYVTSIGGPAAAKIVKYGIHPIKTDNAEPIVQIIHQLQTVLASNPPPWLAKQMGIAPKSRIYREEA